MRTRKLFGLLPVVTLVALSACADSPTAPPTQRASASAAEQAVTISTLELGATAALPQVVPLGISASHVVVGRAFIAGQPNFHAFRWEKGELTDLGLLTPGPWDSEATAANAAGEIVGYSQGPSGYAHAFIWRDGVMTDLGTLGHGYSFASDINARGDVVGWSETDAGFPHAYVWSDGVMSELAMLPGGIGSLANGINASGDVVGWSWGSIYLHVAVLWQDGVPTSLGSLGGGGASEATAINARDQVAGWSDVAGTREQHAFVWDRGVMTDLGTLGGTYSYPTGINARGDVVGLSETASGQQHAFLWRDGVMTDLTPSETFSVAQGINDAGEIVGVINHAGALLGVIWTVK